VIISIVLVASLSGTMAYYTMTINSKDATINQLNTTITDQINTIASLNANITNLTNEKNQLQEGLADNITYYNSQISYIGSWLYGNTTLLNETETWLASNMTAYDNYIKNHQYTNDAYVSWINMACNIFINRTVLVNNQTVSEPAATSVNLNQDILWSLWETGIAWYNWTFTANYTGFVRVWVQNSTPNNTFIGISSSTINGGYVEINSVGNGETRVFPIYASSNVDVSVGNGNTTQGATETVTVTYYY